MRRAALVVALFATFASTAAISQIVPPHNSKPEPTAKTDTIPAARDVPYPGTMQLTVDASDVTRAIFRIHQAIPVPGPGDFVLLYPKWVPGGHSPRNDIKNITGFRRERERPRAGNGCATISTSTLSTSTCRRGSSRSTSTINMSRRRTTIRDASWPPLTWRASSGLSNSLYPAGYFVRQIPVQASVIVPSGWKVATALRPARQTGNRIDYPVTSYEILMDSPLIAGANYRRIPLTNSVALDVMADTPEELAATPAQIDAHKQLVDQAVKAFGSQHYDHYDFLLTISNNLGGNGLEHHRSSEDGVNRGYFTDWENKLRDRNLLPHEFSHSWDGKFRRPADLWTPDYRTPMQNSLLWVYEGQTQFWGYVLGARSGMLSKQDTLDAIAATAATYSTGTPGRAWRPLVDTTNDPIIASRAPAPWRSWQRSEDYYSEGQLIWLDVDRIIRQQSGGKRSIDDFAKAFFGIRDRDWGEVTYTLDDVVATLNQVQPYDWRGYLQRRGLRRFRTAAARRHQRGRLPTDLYRRADQMVEERGEEREEHRPHLLGRVRRRRRREDHQRPVGQCRFQQRPDRRRPDHGGEQPQL